MVAMTRAGRKIRLAIDVVSRSSRCHHGCTGSSDPASSRVGPRVPDRPTSGEGPMARVYVAREAALRRLVAIKVLNPEVSEDETARKRFERESRSAAKIHHQNVATVHRVGSLEDETPFIIMEYIEGRNLADGLQAEGVMTIEQACHTLSQVASALAAAHEKGIVHRDVKPDNVVRERDSDRGGAHGLRNCRDPGVGHRDDLPSHTTGTAAWRSPVHQSRTVARRIRHR